MLSINDFRFLMKKALPILLPLLVLGAILIVSGQTACDDKGTDPRGSGQRFSFDDPCA
ncbi:MAG: hypothetical protein ACXAE3_15755 [Candidatus Kariarchaeaceae archaeon]|jgi:hypothetical protein